MLRDKRELGPYVRVDPSLADAKRVMANVLGVSERKLRDLIKRDRSGPRPRAAACALGLSEAWSVW